MPGQGHRACRFAFLRWMCNDCFHNRKTRTDRQSGIACPKWEAAGFGHIVWMQASPVRRTTTGVSIRLLAKLGIAPRSGRGGRGFESRKANVVGDNDCMRSCNHAGVAQRQSGFLVRNRSRFRNSSSALIQAFICNPYRFESGCGRHAVYAFLRHRITVSTSVSQAENTGSIPVGGTAAMPAYEHRRGDVRIL